MNAADLRKAIACIPEHQRSIFMPQIEQFNIEMAPMKFGVMGKVRVPQASGWCWAASIDEDRMITIVRITLSDDFPFYENPQIEYSCISTLSMASARIIDAIWDREARGSKRSMGLTVPRVGAGGAVGCRDDVARELPASAPLLEADAERVMAFTLMPRLYESPLAAGTTHVGANVHLFPGYFEKLERQCPEELGWLKKAIDSRVDASESIELRSILRSITPRQANQPGAHMHYEAKTLEAVSALARFCSNERNDTMRNETSIENRVKELLATSLDRPPKLDELASACYTSRTVLCNEFKRTSGMSIGAYLAELRIAHAKALLASTDDPITSIARQVGYRHASTFATTFKHACGTTPQAWRISQHHV